MKLSRKPILAAVAVLATSLTGCSTNTGKAPDTAMTTSDHGVYWKANPKDSIAKNAYSLAGVDVSFKDEEVTPGSSDEAGLSKYLINGTMGAVTGGVKGLSIMSLASLYSTEDAEFITTEQYVAFVPNPNNLPFDDESLVKAGARTTFEFVKGSASNRGFDASKRIAAVDQCKINRSMMAKFDECLLPSKPTKDIAFDNRLFEFQAIRPATGNELAILGLKKGSYSVIRYGLMQTDLAQTSKGYSGFIMRPNVPYTTPQLPAISINGQDYYLFKGTLGLKGFPEKKLTKKFW